MDNIKTFSIKRIMLLIKKSMYESKKNTIRGFSILFGVFTIVYLISQINGAHSESIQISLYYIGLFVAGVFASGMAFANFRNKEKTMNYLSLPASNFEKFISELLISTIGFVVVYTLVFYLFNTTVMLVSKYYGIDTYIVNVFETNNLKMFRMFFIMHSVLFAGAATFKKVPPLNTAFVLFITGIIILLYVSLLGWILSKTVETSTNVNIQIDDGIIMSSNMMRIVRFAFFYLTAPVFWTVAFFKIKEKQV